MQGGVHPAHSRHLCDPEPLVWGVVEEPPTGSGRTGAFVSVSAQDEERSERSQEAQCPPVGGPGPAEGSYPCATGEVVSRLSWAFL